MVMPLRILTLDEFGQLLSFNPDTAIFTWRERPLQFCKDQSYQKRWNNKFANTIAGCLYDNGYRYIHVTPNSYLEHRLVWLFSYGRWPSAGLDHIDGDRANNLISNLRSASHLENAQNQKVKKTNTSGFTGVQWCAKRSKWEASIVLNYKGIYLGAFDLKEDARDAYQKAKARYHTFNPVQRV